MTDTNAQATEFKRATHVAGGILLNRLKTDPTRAAIVKQLIDETDNGKTNDATISKLVGRVVHTADVSPTAPMENVMLIWLIEQMKAREASLPAGSGISVGDFVNMTDSAARIAELRRAIDSAGNILLAHYKGDRTHTAIIKQLVNQMEGPVEDANISSKLSARIERTSRVSPNAPLANVFLIWMLEQMKAAEISHQSAAPQKQ